MVEPLQIKVLSDELQKLRPNVTKKDREGAMQTLGIKSHATVSNYLNGKGTECDTAASLITFFKERISNRNLVVA